MINRKIFCKSGPWLSVNDVTPYARRACAVAPEITMPNRRMGQARGRQTILECVITAFPQTVNYWEKDGQRLTSSPPDKYHVDVYDDGDHRIVLCVT